MLPCFQSFASVRKPMIEDPVRDAEKANSFAMTDIFPTIPHWLRGLTIASLAVSTAAWIVSMIGVGAGWPFYYLYGVTIAYVLTLTYHAIAIIIAAHHHSPDAPELPTTTKDVCSHDVFFATLKKIAWACAAPVVSGWWIGAFIQASVSLHRAAQWHRSVERTVIFLLVVELGVAEAVLMAVIAVKHILALLRKRKEPSSRPAGPISL